MLWRWVLGACLALWLVSVAAAAEPIWGAPQRFPYLPHLTQDRAPDICRALEAAEQDSFKSARSAVSAIDREWPGAELKWVISPATVSRDAGNLTMVYPVDLDGDGKSELLVLKSEVHSWRGNVFSLVRFGSEDTIKTFESRTGESSPERSSDVDDLFPSNWHIPAVLTENGRYYLLDEGGVAEDTPPATLYRIPATGKPEPLCTIERRPSQIKDWESEVGLTQLTSDLSAIVGGSGFCGTLNTGARLAIDARRVRTQALLRPWATDWNPRYDNTQSADAWLAKWATEGVWNWRLYNQFKSDEPQALQSLGAWYAEAFGITNAGQEARRVMDLIIRSHFLFSSMEPKVSPLAAGAG